MPIGTSKPIPVLIELRWVYLAVNQVITITTEALGQEYVQFSLEIRIIRVLAVVADQAGKFRMQVVIWVQAFFVGFADKPDEFVNLIIVSPGRCKLAS